MISTELLSLLGGAVSGFIFKYMAQAQSDRQAQFDNLLKAQAADDASADAAAKRENTNLGNWTRILIVMTVLFGVITAPFILTLLNKPVAIQVTTPMHSLIGGLIQWGGNAKFYQFNSYLMVPEVRAALLAIIGFYFGASTAKRS